MMPLDYATDREVLDAALPTMGLTEAPNVGLMWIRSTLDIAEVECSAAYWDQARSRDDLQILTEPRPLPFDERGLLRP